MSQSLWQGANYDAGSLFFKSFLVRSRFRSGLVNLTYQAQINYEVTGRLVPRGWKVALAKFRFAFAMRKEEEKEKRRRDGDRAKDDSSRISSVRVIEIWATRFSHGRRDLAFQGCSVSRIHACFSRYAFLDAI